MNKLRKSRPPSALSTIWRETVFTDFKDKSESTYNLPELQKMVKQKEVEYYEKNKTTVEVLLYIYITIIILGFI